MMKKLLLIMILLLLPVLGFAAVAAGEQQIDPEEIEQVLNDFLDEQSARLPHVELHFRSIDLPKTISVPDGHIEYQVIPAKPDVIGSRRLTLLTRVDGDLADNRSIRIELDALAEILVAADNLRRGDVLSPDNVSLVQQDISDLKHPLFDGEDVFGKRLKRSVRLGQPILYKQVEFPPLIKRGDRVTIQAQRGGLILTAAGEAKEDGSEDETIRVINLGSRKVVLCRVVDAGLVMVEF